MFCPTASTSTIERTAPRNTAMLARRNRKSAASAPGVARAAIAMCFGWHLVNHRIRSRDFAGRMRKIPQVAACLAGGDLRVRASFEADCVLCAGTTGMHREIWKIKEKPGSLISLDSLCILDSSELRSNVSVVQASHGQVDGRSRHPARLVGSDEHRHVCHLRECHEPSRVGPACEQLQPLFPGHSRYLGARLEGILDRACLRHALCPQTDHTDALRCELGG